MALPIENLLDVDTWTWFHNRLKSNSSNFNSAKDFEFIGRKKTSDGENDSGYAPSNDLKPRLSKPSKLFMAESLLYDDCDDDDDDDGENICEEEEAAEIHHSIETIVEGLLGRTLDDAPVDLIYSSSPDYEKLFLSYHGQLVEAIKNLSHSLRRALHSIPHQNNCTPTTAHAALKNLITTISADCQELPYLQLSSDSEEHFSEYVSPGDVAIFSSYEGLVASAVINKIIEESQLSFAKPCSPFSSSEPLEKLAIEENCYHRVNGNEGNTEGIIEAFSVSELPLECIQIEEVEEITHEYTDSDDDFSSISHHSSGIQSIDDNGMQRCGSEVRVDYYDTEHTGRIPFPEFGSDLVEDITKIDSPSVCYPSIVSSWQENWLFKKKKRTYLCNTIKHQLLTYDEPSLMLIPCPLETINSNESAALSSEPSELNSIGSLEFLFENLGNFEQSRECRLKNSEDEASNEMEIENNLSLTLPIGTMKDYPLESMSKLLEQDTSVTSAEDILSEKIAIGNIECDTVSEYTYRNESHIEVQNSSHQNFANVSKSNARSITSLESTNSQADDRQEDFCPETNPLVCVAAGDISLIPTHPGTIAEREHKKWLNAVPWENNPYSAENISRRKSNRSNSLFSEQNQLEEFEQNLLHQYSHEIKEPLQKKLYCGLRSIDGNLYKRDYYVHNQNLYETTESRAICNFETLNHESYASVPEEALNSLEEKVYVGAGKIFTAANHVERLERELKDISLESTHLSSDCLHLLQKDMRIQNIEYVDSDDEKMPLPSVKNLATKFTCQEEQYEASTESASDKKDSDVKIKKSRPCIKVHSLTARSLSREFRDKAKQNILKPMNRFFTVPTQVSDDTTSEQESICSPSDVPQVDLTHGYTSDESSNGTCSPPRLKTPRHISRSILQRACYWQRRVEQGLLSDASVGEDFPGLENTKM